MSLYGNLLSSDQFQCSICLDIFNNPSSTPCGHSFCVTCINQYWDGAKVCQCPLCKRTFQKRPDLQINRTLREITEQFRSMSGGGMESKTQEMIQQRLVKIEDIRSSVSQLEVCQPRARFAFLDPFRWRELSVWMRRVQEFAGRVTKRCRIHAGLHAAPHPSRLTWLFCFVQVWCGDRHQLLPDNVERFDRVVCVLGREAITSGRHYWEVQVGGKTDWDLGVARQSINRKGKIDVTPNNGYWFLSLRDKNKYAFRTEPSTDVHLNLRPNKIGVFVDFDRGQVSFYNVDAKIHIYTFNDTFTECIFPFFSPCTNRSGKNDGPLVITPVDVSE
uniref:Bloodthirsty-related gene family, member 1 n=1 Tax=Hippocampus comes TaxID=109280 RepID=A0A3Q2Z1K6_HIPCM